MVNDYVSESARHLLCDGREEFWNAIAELGRQIAFFGGDKEDVPRMRGEGKETMVKGVWSGGVLCAWTCGTCFFWDRQSCHVSGGWCCCAVRQWAQRD
jgi:hypothetical protein